MVVKEFEELTSREQAKVLITARQWRRAYSFHVDQLLKEEVDPYPPSGTDMFRPELWKPAMWRWFAALGSDL